MPGLSVVGTVNDRSASQVRARFTGRASSPIMTPSAPRHGCTNSDFSHFKETGARPANAAGLHNFSELQVRTVDGTAGVAAYRRPGSCSVRSRRYRAARLTDVRRTRSANSRSRSSAVYYADTRARAPGCGLAHRRARAASTDTESRPPVFSVLSAGTRYSCTVCFH